MLKSADVHAAGDSIKVPEAATEAASNVTAAVRKAGERQQKKP